jgi:uncharacterized membrane protein
MNDSRQKASATSVDQASIRGAVLTAAVVVMGLLTGFFFAYASSVMPGLGQVDDRTFVDGMQQINEATENPVFFLSLFGAPALILAALVMEHGSGSRQVVGWLAAALVLYGVAFVITGALHIPLNNDLADAGDPGRIADLAAVRDDFEDPWVAWHIVRTVALTAAFGCLTYALLQHGRSTARPEPAPTR